MLPKNRKLKNRAQKLRREMTREERHLWYDFLRDYPVQFNRQKVIGSYIVDFYCDRAKLVVELDGSQHFEEDGLRYDADRTALLSGEGLTVLRVSNHDIWENFSGVCTAIHTAVDRSTEQL